MSTPATATPVTPVPATPPATPPVTPPPERTQMDKQATSKFFERFGAKPKEPATPPPATPPAAPPPEPAKPKAKVKDKPEFDPALPTPPVKAQRVDADEIKSIVSAAVSGAMEAQRKPEAKTPEPEIPKGIARKIELLGTLETDTPELKQVKVRTAEFYRKGGAEDQYRSKWLEAHPGKKYDREDEEHDTFYAEQDPLAAVSEDDWDEARDRWAIKRAEESAAKTVTKTLEHRGQQEAQTRAAGGARTELDRMAMDTIKELSPALAEMAKTPDKLRTLDKDDPIAEHVLVQTVGRYAPAVEGVLEIFGGVPFDSNKQTHQAVNQLGVELEDRILAMPTDKQMSGGRKFATISQLQQMPAADRKRFWSIGQKELLSYINGRVKTESKGLYDRLRGTELVQNSERANGNGKHETPAEEAETQVITDSPSVSASSQAPPPGSAASTGPAPKGNAFFKSWMGK